MSKLNLIANTILLLIISGVFSSYAFAGEGWYSSSQISKKLRKLIKTDQIVTKLNCRQDAKFKNSLRPEFYLKWTDNTQDRMWSFTLGTGIFSRGQLSSEWKRISIQSVKSPSGSGTNYNCSLWHAKKPGGMKASNTKLRNLPTTW